MIVPSIDVMGGRTVQLVGGEQLALEAGDPAGLVDRFHRVGEVAVIDLDAALGQGDNRALLEPLLARADCRVGGGIRDEATAVRWLDAGARRIILGTAATPALLSRLPRDRLIAALDARHGEVVVKGWTEATGRRIAERMAELRPYVSGFLVTFVENEGRMGGVDLAEVEKLRDAAGAARLTFAGGVTTAEEVAALDRLGVDAQVGMALYTGRLRLADAFAAPLRSDRPDGLWPTLVSDEHGTTLGLAYSDRASLDRAIETGRGVYHSRRRGLWVKGETSGDGQELVTARADCDRDALRFVVRQEGRGFCHEGTWTCFGEDRGLGALERLLRGRVLEAPAGSYTRRLLDEPGLLEAKLREEAAELAAATDADEVRHESADVLYFTLVAMARRGVRLEDVARTLDLRHRRHTRRPGDAKPEASS